MAGRVHDPARDVAGVPRRAAYLVALLVAAGVACAERRPQAAGDSSGVTTRDDPTAEFLARRGRTWELARLGDQEIPAPATRAPSRYPGDGSRPTIRFTSERLPTAPANDSLLLSAGGRSFCNGYGAGYEVGPGDRLRFRQFQSTLVGCDGADSLETRFFRALGATQRFALDSTTLVLVAADGSRLTFEPAPPR